MKRPEEWESVWFTSSMSIEYFVKLIQKDAYNQALIDLANDDLLLDKEKNLKKYMK